MLKSAVVREIQLGRKKVETIELQKGLKLVSPFPAAYLDEQKALLISDTHLGIESKLPSRGVYVPKSVLRDTLDSVLIPARELDCKKVFILGDLKHECGRPRESDWWSVRRFVDELRAIGAEPVLIRGNHDRCVRPILRSLKVETHASHLFINGFLLTHGHRKIKVGDSKKIKAAIIGHEHPAISLQNEFGGRNERFKAFLFVPGRSKGRDPPVLVLPSVNPLAYGTDINALKVSDFLSPYLNGRKACMMHAKPYALEVGELLLPFPEISELRNALGTTSCPN